MDALQIDATEKTFPYLDIFTRWNQINILKLSPAFKMQFGRFFIHDELT